jgi:hypothetical protein
VEVQLVDSTLEKLDISNSNEWNVKLSMFWLSHLQHIQETLLRCKSSTLFELYSKHVEWYHIAICWCSQVTGISRYSHGYILFGPGFSSISPLISMIKYMTFLEAGFPWLLTEPKYNRRFLSLSSVFLTPSTKAWWLYNLFPSSNGFM